MAASRRQTKLITGSPAPEPEKRNYMREYFRMVEDVLRRLDVEHKYQSDFLYIYRYDLFSNKLHV